MKPATPTSKEPAIFTCRTLQSFFFLLTLPHHLKTTRIMSVSDLPQATAPQPPTSPNIVEPRNPKGHSAYYIKEILAWLIVIVALFVLFLLLCATIWALLPLLCAMVWALHQDWPYFWGPVLVVIGFSQIRQYWKLMRRMRGLKRWMERDVEAGNEEGGGFWELEVSGGWTVVGREDAEGMGCAEVMDGEVEERELILTREERGVEDT
jgi:hypothetical protein